MRPAAPKNGFLNKQSKGQTSLLNKYGTPNFCFDSHVAPTGSGNEFDIGAMKIVLMPPPRDKRKATSLVLESLCALRQSGCKWRGLAFEHVLPKVGEVGSRYVCVVTMRLRRDDGVIRAELVEHRKIELSLPHTTTWKANGLGWLTQFDNCCETERANPTPWLGRACTCQSSETG